MKFPEKSEMVLASLLSKYEEGKLPPHLQAALNMMRYARWAKWKIHRLIGTNSEKKDVISAMSMRVRQLRLELDEKQNAANQKEKQSSPVDSGST